METEEDNNPAAFTTVNVLKSIIEFILQGTYEPTRISLISEN